MRLKLHGVTRRRRPYDALRRLAREFARRAAADGMTGAHLTAPARAPAAEPAEPADDELLREVILGHLVRARTILRRDFRQLGQERPAECDARMPVSIITV